MKVSAAVMNFRDALAGLVPAFDRAGIPWKRPDAYDDWDAVASALFSALVQEVLRAELPEAFRDAFALAEYDLLLPNYRDKSTIELAHTDGRDGRRIFHAFGSDAAPFDTIEYCRVSDVGDLLSDTLERAPLGSVSLRLRALNPRSKEELILE